MFKWKNRSGAVSQAAYEYAESVKRTQEMINTMSPEDMEYYRKNFSNEDPNWKMKVNLDGTFEGAVRLVLGTGSRYKDYFCIDPENMPFKTWTRFKNEVRKEIENRESTKRILEILESNKS